MSAGDLTLTLPEGAEDRAAALDVLVALSRLAHPHLVPCTLQRPTDATVSVGTGDPAGIRLTILLGGRWLAPGQVVTVGVPIAQALEEAAAQGVHHGSIDAASILVEPDGRPMLVGVGLSQLVGAHPTGPDDVHMLARMLGALLDPESGAAGAEVSAALAPALSGHPSTRPTAAGLAAALLGAAAPVALPAPEAPTRGVRTVHPAPRPKPRRIRLPEVQARLRTWRLPPRPVLVGIAAVLLLLVLVGVVALSGRKQAQPREQASAPPPPPPVVIPSPSASPAMDWQRELTLLAQARQRAFSAADPALLRAADAPRSSADAVDRQRVQTWARAKVYLRGAPASVQLLSVAAAGRSVTVLHVRERTAAFDVVAAATGSVAEHHPAGAAHAWTVTLVSTPQGWRTASVS